MNPVPNQVDSSVMDSPDNVEDAEMREMEFVQNPAALGGGQRNWQRVAAGGGIPGGYAVGGMINRVVSGAHHDEDEDDDDEEDEEDDEEEEEDDDDDDDVADVEDGELIVGSQFAPDIHIQQHRHAGQIQPGRRLRSRKQVLAGDNGVVLPVEGEIIRHNGGVRPTPPSDFRLAGSGVVVNLEPEDGRQRRMSNRRPDEDSVISSSTGQARGASSAKENGEVPMEEEEEDDESRSEGTFSFKVDNISRLKDTALSKPYFVRNLPWKIMVMQRTTPGNDKAMVKSLGFFLQCNGESESSSWSCNATADLRMMKHNGEDPFSRRISHLFYSKENDWGFSHFVTWQDIFDPEKGFVKDDAITLEVHVTADAPHGVSWDSKKHTGYVGLKNQGATCYMNSLLQVLYFTNRLRKAVYKMPTESDDSTRSVPLALQRVFYELQFTDKPVGTKKLTKSFGWETLDSFMQHDVQEFLRVLLDNLESKMKRTSVEGTIPKLFEGKMISYIKCKNVNYSSSRTEPFYDIQLNVKGKKNIYESFKDYTAVETLEGENRYDAGQLGMQDAVKGVTFTKFPPVLYLHLMRFQYDPMTDTNVKINDRFEFPNQLDLTEFIQSKEETPSKYTLHAVLVHSGDNHGGHYVVFINPKGDGKWCKFDDDVVSKCSKADAIDHNFGGSDEELGIGGKHCTNAYMLVYIRDSELPWVLGDVKETDIPSELTERIQEEKRLEAVKRKERNEQHQYMTVHLVTEDDFKGHQLPDLFDIEKVSYTTFKVKKLDPLENLEEMIASSYCYRRNQLRLWPVIQRTNMTHRPGPRSRMEPKRSVMDASTNSNPWNVFLELQRADSDQPALPDHVDRSRTLLVFFKLYEPKDRRIYYIGYHHVPQHIAWKDVFPLLNRLAGFPPDTPLLLFEEIKPNLVERVEDVNLRGEKEELTDGDIFVYQRVPEAAMEFELPTAKEFYREMHFRMDVLFCDKNVPSDPGFKMTLSQRYTFKDMVLKVAKRLNTDPDCIQFFKSTNYRDSPGSALRCDPNTQLKELLLNKPRVKKLFYQLLSIKVNELDRKKQMKCVWVGMNCKEEKEVILYPNKNGHVRDLLAEAARSAVVSIVGQEGGGTGKLRLLEVTVSKIQYVVKEDLLLEMLNTGSQKQLRIEEVPLEELEDGGGDSTLVPCAHFHKEVYTTFGVPFFLRIRENESLSSVKSRIQKKLEVSDKEFEKWRFALVSGGRPAYLEDDHIFHFNGIHAINGPAPGVVPKIWLGLEHLNKAPKKTRYTYLEKAIKIHN